MSHDSLKSGRDQIDDQSPIDDDDYTLSPMDASDTRPGPRPSLDLVSAIWLARHPLVKPSDLTPRKQLFATVYTRFSDEVQDPFSTERQLKACLAYAKRIGALVEQSDIYSDEGRSGSTMQRRERLHAMLERIEAGGIDIVIIEVSNRMARSFADMAKLYTKLKKHKVELHSALRGPMSKTDVAMFGVADEEEKAWMLWRLSQGRRKLVARGLVPTARCFGYVKVPGRPGLLKVDEGKRSVIERIFGLRAEGVSFGNVAVSLNASGIKSSKGKEWDSSMVRSLVTNPLYMGLIVYGRYEARTDHDEGRVVLTPRHSDEWLTFYKQELAIVSEATWKLAQPVVANGKTRPRSGGPSMKRYLLSGRVRCPDCGGKMHLMRGYPQSLGCAKAQRKKTCGNRDLFRHDLIEKVVFEALASQLETPELHQAYLDALNVEIGRGARENADDRQRLTGEITEMRRRIDRLFDDSFCENASMDSIARNRRRYEERQNTAQAKLAALPVVRGTYDIDVGQVRGLADAMRSFAASGRCNVRDDASARIIDAARACLGTVHVRRRGDALWCRIGFRAEGLADRQEEWTEGDPVKDIEIIVPISRTRGRYAATYLRRSAASKNYVGGPWLFDDADWSLVSDLVPPSALAHYDGWCANPRLMVELCCFLAVHHRPLANIPEEFGDLLVVRRALRVLVSSGRWDRIVARLMAMAPRRLAGYDPARLRSFRRSDRKRLTARAKGPSPKGGGQDRLQAAPGVRVKAR